MPIALVSIATLWSAAEQYADVSALDALLLDDFLGIGPVGFVLPKHAWLDRFAQGLHYEHLALDEVSTRRYGNTAVIVAHQHTRGDHQGAPTPPDSRVSLVVVSDEHGADWRIASIHYSFIAGPPGGTA
jgi:ketosteroid isomerase-like protein